MRAQTQKVVTPFNGHVLRLVYGMLMRGLGHHFRRNV